MKQQLKDFSTVRQTRKEFGHFNKSLNDSWWQKDKTMNFQALGSEFRVLVQFLPSHVSE